MPQESNTASQNFNYRITKFFLDNNRATIFTFLLLLILGIGATALLKTTGFPNPDINIALVQTLYPGASSETVVKEVTIPLEGAIKNVNGIKRFNSTSTNSFSTVVVTLEEDADPNTVITKIDSEIRRIDLPEGAQDPKITQPNVGGPDAIYAITAPDKTRLWEAYDRIQRDLSNLTQTSSLTTISEIEKKVVVKLKNDKLQDSGITAASIQQRLGSIQESIPVLSELNLDNKNTSLVTSIEGNDLNAIKNLEFSPTPKVSPAIPTNQSNPLNQGGQTAAPKIYKLSELADVEIVYDFVEKKASKYAFQKNNSAQVVDAVYIQLKATAGTDQNQYSKEIKTKFEQYDDQIISYGASETQEKYDPEKTNLIEVFSANQESQDQVQEVVDGLIGGPLDIEDKNLAQVGWLLGGIQLVMLSMIAFVSWRAALIAAASIPLSLLFTNIYLYLIGETLNTLVLFSLVLALGLVVDPALVILESIQRKIDAGFKGREAVLEAVKDVGNGIFLAAVSNIIVFIPFGVLSGLLGKIFAYIPLTIISATVGSYIIPLIFLAWLGGLILKPSKNSVADEEKNLWGAAKGLIWLNTKILHSPRWFRLLLIIIGLIIPLAITNFYINNTKQVKIVTFASDENTNLLLLSGSFTNSLPQTAKDQATEKVLRQIATIPEVKDIIPFGNQNSFLYRIQLDEAKNRGRKSVDIVNQLNDELSKNYQKDFFDIKVELAQIGPPTADYQVALAIKSEDLDKLSEAAQKVGEEMAKLCKDGDEIVLDENCNGSNEKRLVVKVDDGFTGKENRVLEVVLNRKKLAEKQAALANAPLSILANSQIKEQFELNSGDKVGTIQIDQDTLNIFLEQDSKKPSTIEDLKNTQITTITGQKVKLSEIADIQEKQPKNTIDRVRGQTVALVQARLDSEFAADQAIAGQANQKILKFYQDNNFSETTRLGLEKEAIGEFADGSNADTQRSFQELLIALVLAIFVSYIALALFFRSFAQPLTILYTIPLTLIGLIPGLAYFGGGQIGFLEIIGIIILIGLVENVAIFLIDSAYQKMDEGWDDKKAIAYAAGVRLRPVILTNITGVASLAPLAIFSVFYRSIAVVIMFGLGISVILSLVTTPILFIFFRWISRQYRFELGVINKILFFLLPIIGIVYFGFAPALSFLPRVSQILSIIAIIAIFTPIWYILYLGIKDRPAKNPS